LKPIRSCGCDRCISASAILLSIKLIRYSGIFAIVFFGNNTDAELGERINGYIVILVINISRRGQAAIIVAEPEIFLGGIDEGATGDRRDYFAGLGVVPPVANQDPGAAM